MRAIGQRFQKDVRGLEIAVNHPGRVNWTQNAADLKDVAHGLPGRNRPSRRHLRQILAGQVFHDDVGSAAGQATDIEDPRNVGATHPGGDLRFADQARGRLGIGPVKNLDRHATPKLEVQRREDNPHSTAAEQSLDPILVGPQGVWFRRRRRERRHLEHGQAAGRPSYRMATRGCVGHHSGAGRASGEVGLDPSQILPIDRTDRQRREDLQIETAGIVHPLHARRSCPKLASRSTRASLALPREAGSQSRHVLATLVEPRGGQAQPGKSGGSRR